MTAPEPPSEKQKAAYAAGRSAFANGFESTTCPYSLTAPDPERLGKLWVRGFVDARIAAGVPAPVPARSFELGKPAEVDA